MAHLREGSGSLVRLEGQCRFGGKDLDGADGAVYDEEVMFAEAVSSGQAVRLARFLILHWVHLVIGALLPFLDTLRGRIRFRLSQRQFAIDLAHIRSLRYEACSPKFC